MTLDKPILIVEDRKSTRIEIEQCTEADFESITVSSDNAANALFNQSKFSCLILGEINSDRTTITENCRSHRIPFVELVEKGNVLDAVASIQRGAAGVIESPSESSAAILKAIETATDETKNGSPDEDWERFIRIVRHDLKAPLRTINGFAKLLKKTVADTLSEDEIEYLDFIIDSASDGYQLLDKLRELQELGCNHKNKTLVDLDSVVTYAIHSLRADFEKSSASIHVNNLPSVYGDEGDLALLFKNLFSNSLTFAEEAPSITVSAVEKCNHWEISVSDNGIGFEQEYSDKIFEPCTRLNATTLYQGSGLGLTICQRIANLHGGKVEATSTPEVGSTFTVSLKRS